MARSPHIHTYDMSHPFLLSYYCTIMLCFVVNVKKFFMPSWTQHDGPYLGCVRNNNFLGEKKNIGFGLDFFLNSKPRPIGLQKRHDQHFKVHTY